MKPLILMSLALALVAGCTARDDRVRFDGEVFRGKASHDRDDRRKFTVEVSPVSASLDGAREAGRFEGIKYCINEYGTSNIEWSVGPDTDPAALVIERDRLSFAGMCKR
ncbi:hypothetical protein [Aestuariivita sp.]|jgi:hypothetical protein|uniref:hypothetical protein n=1 Tax=Aestuariivita sp. TaxID=1872407 RepID=UPI0025BED0AF|nr:hypothetical protein [Aestuariivita sp.]